MKEIQKLLSNGQPATLLYTQLTVNADLCGDSLSGREGRMTASIAPGDGLRATEFWLTTRLGGNASPKT